MKQKTKKIKAAKRDFTVADLPSSRKALLLDCLREQYSCILRLGAICVAVFLPLLVVTILRDGALYSITQSDAQEKQSMLKMTRLIFGLGRIAGLAVLFCGVSGCMQVLRRLLWQEPVFFGEDLKDGLKNNGRRFCMVCILAALPFYALEFYTESFAVEIVEGILCVTVLPLSGWMLAQTVYYRLSVGQTLRNAIIFYVKTFPTTLLLTCAVRLPWVILESYISRLMIKYIAMLVFVFLMVVPLGLACLNYACGVFDECINKANYPQIYKKGLRKENGGNEQ